ncbi:MAG: sulfatase-like hydrolase/transferase, partial [Verrucomicrobiota bacterium]
MKILAGNLGRATTLSLSLLLLLLLSTAWASSPNVVLIVADDLGWADTGPRSDLHETPNLDRLTHESVSFSNACAASPVCTPTRASLLTGRHPARLHMTIWREAAADRGNRTLLEPITRSSLPLRETTQAEI